MLILDQLDTSILNLLETQELHTSEIARRLNVGRTTTHYRLNRLQRMGFVVKHTEGRKTLWSRSIKTEHNKSLVKTYKDRDFVQAYQQLLSLPAETVIFAVQGSKAASGEFNALPETFIKKAHQIFKRKKFILKGLSHKDALKAFTNINQPLIQSHIGRTLGIKMFQDAHFQGAGEILATPHLLLLANPNKKLVVVIKEKGITEIVYDLLDVMFEILDGGHTFDLNAYLHTNITST